MSAAATRDEPNTLERSRFARRRWRVCRLVALGVAVVAAVWLVVPRSDPGRQRVRLVTVTRTPIEQALTEVGRVEAKNVTLVVSPVSGEITWMIEEGTEVGPGDIIVKLSQEEILEQIDDLEQRMVPVENELKKAQLDLAVVKEKTRLQIEQTELGLDEARAKLRELEIKPTPEEKMKALLDLEVAKLEAERATKEYATSNTLFEKGLVSELVLKQRRLSALNAEARLELARAVFSIRSRGAEKLAVELARAQAQKAELQLEETKFNARSDTVIAEKELAVRSVRLANSERDLERRRKQLADCDVKAPVPGRVVFVNVWKGSSELSPIRIGENRRRGWDLLKIADTSALTVKVLINEVDLRKVKLGEQARVRLVAYPEDIFAGKVTHIGLAAADKNQMLGPLALARSGEAGVKVVEVTVELAENDERIRLGFSAEVEIVTDVVEAALTVPRSAVGRSGDGPYCLVWRSGSAGRVPVELGAATADTVQVVSGLKEGETVVGDLAAYGVD